MLTLEQAQKIVSTELEKLDIPAKPENLYNPVRYILSIGGKRIRPALVLLGANLFSEDVSSAVYPAVGIEIFHNFTLLHDDLMDKSEIRRGRQTVHLKWNQNVSILSGDVMSIMAGRYISRVDEKYLALVMESYNRTAIEVCEGQMMDMDFEERKDVSIDEYIEMIRLKTSVLIAAGLEIGALSAGAGKKKAGELYNFGLNLGLAFQLQDDLLDSFGDTRTFGKKVGNDILANKKTYLMISLLNRVGDEDAKILEAFMENKNPDPERKIAGILSLYKKYGIKESTESKISDYFDLAGKILKQLDIPEERKFILRNFSDELQGRKF